MRVYIFPKLYKFHSLSRVASSNSSTLRPSSFFSRLNSSTGDSTGSPSEGQQNVEAKVPDSNREEELMNEIKKLQEKINEIDDKYKRALAESENTRVRMRRQIEEAKIFGIQKFCTDLLEVADVLHMAVEASPKDVHDYAYQNLYKGVQMTETHLQSVFRRYGLIQINPIGLKFDPNEHQSMFEVEEPTKEPGTVSIVTKIGYKLNERTLRPAMVGIVKARDAS